MFAQKEGIGSGMRMSFELPDGEPADWDMDEELEFIADAMALAEEYFSTGSYLVLRSHRRALLNLGVPSYRLRDIMISFVASPSYVDIETSMWIARGRRGEKVVKNTSNDKLPDPEDITPELITALLYREATDVLGNSASRIAAISRLARIHGMNPPKETRSETTVVGAGTEPVVNVYLNADQASIAEHRKTELN